MGPLELAEFVGVDVMLNVMDVLHRGFGDPKFRAAPLLRQMVAAGHLGRKTGRGFYRYDEQGNKIALSPCYCVPLPGADAEERRDR